MSNPSKADAIRARISQLESDTAAQVVAIQDAEKSVAAAYESGDSPAAAVKNLAQLRDELSGQVAALRTLDSRWYAVAEEEFQQGLGRVRAETNRRYIAAVQAIEAKLSEIDLAVHGLGVADLDPFRKELRESLWDVFLRRSVEAQQAVGRPPREPWPRDDLGRQIDPAATGPSASQFRITSAEAAFRAAMDRFNQPGNGIREVRGQ